MKLRHLIYICLLVLALWGAGLFWFISNIPNQPENDTVNTDAIVVLTGGGLRMERGFELLAAGRAPKMFVSGVEDGVTITSLLRNKDYKSFAGKVSPASVTLGHKARSTTGNASEIAEWVAQENVRSIRLVTGNYHMPRSINEIHQAAPKLIIIPEPVFPKHFEDNRWWQFSDGIRLVISEYDKYMVRVVLQSFGN